MKKRLVLFWGILIFLIIVLGSFFSYLHNKEDGTVIFNNCEVTDLELLFDPMDEYIHIYISPALHLLGYNLVEMDENIFMIKDGDREFILNIEDESLYGIGDTHGINYISIAPGATYHYCHRVGDDILIDTSSFNNALVMMGSSYRIVTIPSIRMVIFTQKNSV